MAVDLVEIDSWLSGGAREPRGGLGGSIFAVSGRDVPEEINTIFEPSSGPTEVTEKMQPDDKFCFSGWNCLLKKQYELLRVSTRRVAMGNNTDEMGKAWVPFRSNCTLSGAYLQEQTQIEFKGECEALMYGQPGEAGCQTEEDGAFVCMLPPDSEGFKAMMDCWRQQYAVSLETQEIAFEFITYNANIDMMSYTKGTVRADPSGLVDRRLDTTAFVIRTYQDESEMLALVYLGIYTALVFYYASMEAKKITVEFMKKSQHTRALWFQILPTVVYEHFKDDFFNILDVSSINLSLISLYQFAVFTYQTIRIEDELTGSDWSTFIKSMSDVSDQVKIYTQLSSLNVVVIFLRLLKFFRENARMANVSATLAAAAEDTLYFVLMLIIVLVGFLMFGHVSFGPSLVPMSTPEKSMNYCFQ